MHEIKRLPLLILIMALLAFILSACSSGGTTNVATNENTESESTDATETTNEAISENEEVIINDGKPLIVGTDTSYLPFEYLDEATGEYVGFDIDILKAIADEVGFTYELNPMDFSGIIPALQTNNIDVGIAAMTITEERKQVVDFTDGYYDAGLYILVRADETEINGVEDLAGKKVATKQGTVGYDYSVKIEGIQEVIPFPNIDQAYMELEKGGVDAVIFDSPNIAYYAATAGEGKVKVVGDLLEGQPFGIAFPKGSELRDVFNEALQTIKENGTYDEIYKKWFGD